MLSAFIKNSSTVSALLVYAGTLGVTSGVRNSYTVILDEETKRDLSLIFEILHSINMDISEDLGMQFEQELSTNQNLEMVAGQLVEHVILSHE